MKINAFPDLWFPPLTYYSEGGVIDYDQMNEALESIYPYSKGALVPGSTGDGWVLSQEQQEDLVRFFLRGFGFGRFSMMIGALKPTAEETIASVRRWCEILCEESGCDDPVSAMQDLDVKAFVFCVPAGSAEEMIRSKE